MINTVSKLNLSKIEWEGGGSTSIWIMSLNILLLSFFYCTPSTLRIVLPLYVSMPTFRKISITQKKRESKKHPSKKTQPTVIFLTFPIYFIQLP